MLWEVKRDMQQDDKNASEPMHPRVLITADQAFPALEREFLNSQNEIWASFRIFDLSTKLRSDEARRIGRTWFDLIVHILARGVAINMVVADFDPVARADLHRGTWRTVRMFAAARESAGRHVKLNLRAAMHNAETGILPRLAFLPLILKHLRATARKLNDLGPVERRAALEEMPGVRPFLRLDGRGYCRPKLWPVPPLFPATHHQKIAVFDRRVLYIGGLDLDERRFDTPDHERPGDQTWHDLQLILQGPPVSEAQLHLETFLNTVAGADAPQTGGGFLRTISQKRRNQTSHLGPKPLIREIAAAHEDLTRRAGKLIYLETQFFRDRGLASLLAEAARLNPALSLILIIPAAPEDVAFEGNTGLDARYGEFLQASALKALRKSFGKRLFVGGAARPRHQKHSGGDSDRDRLHEAPIIYIHAKVSIFDDAAAVVSSANLNGRSLNWDTEAGVLLEDPAVVQDLRRQVMAHWLPGDADDRYFDPETAVAAWQRLAFRNATRRPEDREGFILPYDLSAAEEFGQQIPGFPEEMM